MKGLLYMNVNIKRRLENILMFAKRVQSRIKPESIESFLANEEKQDSILYCLGQIGEVANKTSDEEQEKYPALFWDEMIGLRHRLFHDYEKIDFTKVYHITQKPIFSLISELEIILSKNEIEKP
jgi:uncharacterized protein with HEPN domain